MNNKLSTYRKADEPLPKSQWLLPLYGAGNENLGRDGQLIEVPVPEYGPDELLIRHDAVGLCFSDTKVIRQGPNHPRIYKDMTNDPVVLGHEVSMTVVGVGQNLKDEYKVGDRFIIQADIYTEGVNLAYGYMIQGGLSQYNVIDQRILNGDDGNYLIPVQSTTGYAESALTEPWACVIAAYQLGYRTALKPGGITWIIGGGGDQPYSIGAGFDQKSRPAKLLLSNVPAELAAWLQKQAVKLGAVCITTDGSTSEARARISPRLTAPSRFAPSCIRVAGPGLWALGDLWVVCTYNARSRSPTARPPSSAPTSAMNGLTTCV